MNNLICLLSLTCLFLSPCSSWGQTLPAYVPANGLQVYYSLDGNGTDVSINGLHASVFSVTAVNNRFGHAASAVQLNGTSTSYLIRANPVNQVLDGGTGSFTISLWFKTGQTGIRTLVNKRRLSGTTNHEGYSLFLDNGRVKFHLSATNSTEALANCTTAFNDNQWHHVVAIRDGLTKTIRIYVNNQLEWQAADNTTASITTTGDFYLGRWLNYNSYSLSGAIDDMGFWNRILTVQEIEALYNSCVDSINIQPVDQNIVGGDTARLITGYSDLTATYQWQSDIGFGFADLTEAGQYSGVTTPELMVSHVHWGNHNQLFRCIISGHYGCTDTTEVVRILMDISGVETKAGWSEPEVYPNPTSGIVIVRPSASQRICRIELFAVDGSLLHIITPESDEPVSIDLSHLVPGVVLLRIIMDAGQTITRRVVVL